MAAPGLIGKIPSQADFVRVRAGDPVAQAFHRWLEEGHESVKASGVQLADVPTFFLFGVPAGKTVLVGALRPSSDRVGRAFPLAAFVDLDAATAAQKLSALPEAFGAFLQAADTLVVSAASPAAQLSAQALASAVDLLPSPAPSQFTEGDQRRRHVLSSHQVLEVQQLFDAPGVPGAHYYALRTLLMACAAERGREPPKAQVTLDCPSPPGLGPVFWLELVQALLRWNAAPPSLLWTTGPSARLLVTLGPAVPSALLYLAKPDSSASRLWPLKTQKAAAIESAVQALTPSQRQAIDQPSASLAQLCAWLAT